MQSTEAAPDALRWFSYPLDPAALEAYRRELGLASASAALDALGRAVAGSAERALAVATVARPGPRLALLAPRGGEIEAALEAQAVALEAACRRLRFVDWKAAARVAAELAGALAERCGPGLAAAALSAIPRGGWLVAGMVGRHLSGERPRPGAARRRIVVDDCALTGVALRRWLDRTGARDVIFAPLFAARGLAREIERAEPRVAQVVVGEELAERGLERDPREYAAWRRRGAAALAERPYWLGWTDFVAFPWNEPQRTVWIEPEQRLERGWRLLPPERCPGAAAEPRAALVERAEAAAAGELRPADGVVWAEVAGHVYVANLGRAESWRLEGVGAVLWRSLARHGDPRAAAAEVAERFAVAPGRAAADLDSWLATMRRRNLLARP